MQNLGRERASRRDQQRSPRLSRSFGTGRRRQTERNSTKGFLAAQAQLVATESYATTRRFWPELPRRRRRRRCQCRRRGRRFALFWEAGTWERNRGHSGMNSSQVPGFLYSEMRKMSVFL